MKTVETKFDNDDENDNRTPTSTTSKRLKIIIERSWTREWAHKRTISFDNS